MAHIFMDLNMPSLDGLQCIGEIKKNRVFQDISIAVYTGSTQNDDRAKTKALGAVYFLEKPNNYAVLRQMLRVIFEKEMILLK